MLNDDLGLENKEAEESGEGDHSAVLDFVKETLGDQIKEARLSKKLVNHPVPDGQGGVSFEMEKYMQAVQPEMGVKAERVPGAERVPQRFQGAGSGAGCRRQGQGSRLYPHLFCPGPAGRSTALENPSEYADLVCKLMK